MEAVEEGETSTSGDVESVPDVDAGDVPHVDKSSSNVNMWYEPIDYEGGVGKKELGSVEVVFTLQLRYDECATDQERMNPQEGVWFYERTAAMRRHFKRQYPEYFAPKRDLTAARKRQERAKEAEETIRDRKRRGRRTDKVPAVRPEVVDLQAYRKRTGN